VSHLAYGLFRNAIAVCDGYTAAYNLLLRLEGISCAALGNDDHLWTVAVLDGETLHIDVTWGDTESGADERYFAMTSQESYEYHPW
jgi:transglutaminase/protease-like cytokinesis protein 3